MTLNNIVQLIKNFATSHAQLNEFGRGDIPEIGASKGVKYPLLWVVPNPSSWQPGSLDRSMRILLADLIEEDKSNELEVQSDMEQIALDLLALLRDNPDYDVFLTGNVTITFFTDRLTDLVAGVDLTISIRDPKPLDRCVIPLD